MVDIDLAASDLTVISAATNLDALGEGADTVLVLERADLTVVKNDSLAEGYSDARVIAELQTPESVRVVLDHASTVGAGPHEIRLRAAPPPEGGGFHLRLKAPKGPSRAKQARPTPSP